MRPPAMPRQVRTQQVAQALMPLPAWVAAEVAVWAAVAVLASTQAAASAADALADQAAASRHSGRVAWVAADSVPPSSMGVVPGAAGFPPARTNYGGGNR